jgi:hypothetical protein
MSFQTVSDASRVAKIYESREEAREAALEWALNFNCCAREPWQAHLIKDEPRRQWANTELMPCITVNCEVEHRDSDDCYAYTSQKSRGFFYRA